MKMIKIITMMIKTTMRYSTEYLFPDWSMRLCKTIRDLRRTVPSNFISWQTVYKNFEFLKYWNGINTGLSVIVMVKNHQVRQNRGGFPTPLQAIPGGNKMSRIFENVTIEWRAHEFVLKGFQTSRISPVSSITKCIRCQAISYPNW